MHHIPPATKYNLSHNDMKQRFSSIDVKVIAHELSKALVTLRVSNIYDLSTKIFLIKFAKPDNKKQIIIDSGFRCHLTEFARATAAAPSPFVAKMRKYLRTRRVTAVSQVGTDRIIEFQFSDGQYRLYLEFYAGGNIILTDADLHILALLRVVSEGESQEQLRVGLTYSLENRQNYGGVPALTKERLRGALQKAVDRGDGGPATDRASKKKAADALRKALAVSITEYPPMLVDHAMRITNFDSTLKPADVLQSTVLLDHLMQSLQEAQKVVQEITSSDVSKGYIIAKRTNNGSERSIEQAEQGDDTRKGLIYEDFHPFRPQQFEDDPNLTFLQFDGFNKTVDEFFSSIEGQKLESRLHDREAAAKRKIEAARQDQAKRLGGLQELQTLNERKAAAIEVNVSRVQEAIDAVNGLVAQGIDWVEIGKLIELEQKRNNPVATMIKLPLKLESNSITILLDEEVIEDDDSAYETDSEALDSDDDDDANQKKKSQSKQKVVDSRLAIDVNLELSPWSNAREYYDQRRYAVIKEQKTLQSSTKALKSTEIKIQQDLKKSLKQEKAVLRPVRSSMWFEKFHWFISSDGYLVLGGKDAQQNEILYRKYLQKGDVYVHADLHGASTVVIRNNPKTPDAPIPPSTLSQAGTLAVASSSAWDSKAGMPAWWVNADQVSKSAPTGEFLPTGSFMVRGKKNFLPPAQLLLGFGVLFQISDESKGRHVKHRLMDDEAIAISETNTSTRADRKAEDDHENDYEEQESSDSVKGDEPAGGASRDADKEIEDDQDFSDGEEEEEVQQTNSLQPGSLSKGSDNDDNNDDEATTPAQGISKLKIEEPAPTEENSGSESGEEENYTEQTQTGTQTPSQQSSRTSGPLKRGKRGKAKKIARKYKDQDEEDRLAARLLTGGAAGLEKAKAEAKAKAEREAELAFQKERRRAQHQRTQNEIAETEEMRKAMLEEGIETLEPDELEKMTALDTFVGTPLPGDEILEAIPVCAPWNAMGRYKYKVKLQPGTVKKGKAVKEILSRWLAGAASSNKGKSKAVDERSQDTERMWPREIELLRGWKMEEVVNVVPVGKVRVMMSGGSAAGGGGGGGGNGSKGGQGKGGKGGKGGKKR
ncbi:hypothetical protein B7463_g6740, partial [Scytalidium lignicola]